MAKLSNCCCSRIKVDSGIQWCTYCLRPAMAIKKNGKIKTFLSTFLILLISLNCLAPSLPSFPKCKVVKKTNVIEDIPLKGDSILHFLVSNGAECPSIAYAQIMLETGNLTSDIVYTNHNIAGIRTSKSKFTIGKKNGYNNYLTYKDCLRDLIAIQKAYMKRIDGKYAEDPEYLRKIRQFKK